MKKWEWIVMIILFSILIGLILFMLSKLAADTTACINNPIDYYEVMKNTTCWCSNNIR